jgi:hypothetical protein
MARTQHHANRLRIGIVFAHIILGIATSSNIRAQSTDESSALLARAREKIVNATHRLLKCTCLQTIDRTYYVAPVEKLSRHIMTEAPAISCDTKEFGKNGQLSLDAKDRLRLSVAVAGDKEIYSWASASRFDSRSVFKLVSSGPITMGPFGTSLLDIFDNPGVRFKFLGKQSDGSVELLEYSFEVPAQASHYDIGVENGWKVTGYHGSFRIYSATAELASLVEETEQLPPDARMCRAKTSIDYHSVLIGDGEFLIPRQSELKTLTANANETSSVSTFSGYHEYAAESSLRFDGAVAPHQLPSPVQAIAPLPPGIAITLSLLSPLDLRVAAAGDAVSAKMSKAVRAPHSTQILIPAGAIAHGRILQMRHQYSSSQFLISIRFEMLDSNGVLTPLSLALDRQLKAENPGKVDGFRNRSDEFSLAPIVSGETGGLFAFPAAGGTQILPAGFQSKWITVAW